ncbi:unnamed protein product [Lactuca virosa]|uniref:Uncharacterized protein n=1 Tax=Lactuca virosa TaxID=75947 RepID=A0AAU9PS02_9ASTR|nr:unnamed protein product [Lactuca virosa]
MRRIEVLGKMISVIALILKQIIHIAEKQQLKGIGSCVDNSRNVRWDRLWSYSSCAHTAKEQIFNLFTYIPVRTVMIMGQRRDLGIFFSGCLVFVEHLWLFVYLY